MVTRSQATNCDYHQPIWNGLPCTVDELSRVMSDICSRENNAETNSGAIRCPEIWKPVPDGEINSAETNRLRFHVMVHKVLPIAFVGFRCTGRNAVDYDTDWSITMKEWEWSKIDTFVGKWASYRSVGWLAPGLGNMLNRVVDFFANINQRWNNWCRANVSYVNADPAIRKSMDHLEQFLLDLFPVGGRPEYRPKDSLESIEKANRYIRENVLDWARKRNYTVILGGYSLGGFIAQRIGLEQNLHAFCIDSMWGAHKYVPNPTAQAVNKCVSIVFQEDSPINWSSEQVGRVLKVTPPQTSHDKADAARGPFYCFGHNLDYFIDHGLPLLQQHYSERSFLSEGSSIEEALREGTRRIADIYGVDLNIGSGLYALTKAARAFSDTSLSPHERERSGRGWFSIVRQEYKGNVHGEMFNLKNPQSLVYEYGKKCWEHSDGYSSTLQEKADAIRAYLGKQLARRLQSCQAPQGA